MAKFLKLSYKLMIWGRKNKILNFEFLNSTMVRKSGGASKPKSASKKAPVNLLGLEEIMNIVSFDPQTTAGMLPPGFTRCDGEKSAGKVSPFSKDKKAGTFTYDYPKGSPFKMVKKTKSAGEQMYLDLVEAEKRGLVKWSQVGFSHATLKFLQKRLEMLDE